MEGWTVLPDGLVEVGTDRGTYRTEKLVLAGGAWMDKLVPELRGLCVPGRATVAWMQVRFDCKYTLNQWEFVVVLVLQCQGLAGTSKRQLEVACAGHDWRCGGHKTGTASLAWQVLQCDGHPNGSACVSSCLGLCPAHGLYHAVVYCTGYSRT